MKELLLEVYKTTKRLTSVDPSKPGNLKPFLVDDNAFKTYMEGLCESFQNKKDREAFMVLAENTRVRLLENSMFQMNPYESLIFPVLRVFYPKLVAKEAVTVTPMDKPETVQAILTATFTQANGNTQYTAPVTSQDISGGPSVGTPVAASMPVPSTDYDVLAQISLTSTQAHLERDFEITGVSADGTNFTSVSIQPAVEGHFASSVTIVGTGTDVITGKVDYLNGTVSVASTSAVVTFIRYTVTCSLEENRINPTVTLSVDKLRLYSKDRQITANWSVNFEQDMRSLFDMNTQAEMVNIIGQQVALDIDREIVNALIAANTNLNAATHRRTFNRTPPGTYVWGVKYWHENIISDLNILSSRIFTDTNIDQGNTILANPVDVAILEDINTFNYTGTSSVDGEVGYRSATVAGGKWKILTSNVVPAGSMIVIYKPVEDMKAIYIYAPYIPAVLHPYPLGAKPSLTILSRYANAMVRSNGVAVLTIGA